MELVDSVFFSGLGRRQQDQHGATGYFLDCGYFDSRLLDGKLSLEGDVSAGKTLTPASLEATVSFPFSLLCIVAEATALSCVEHWCLDSRAQRHFLVGRHT